MTTHTGSASRPIDPSRWPRRTSRVSRCSSRSKAASRPASRSGLSGCVGYALVDVGPCPLLVAVASLAGGRAHGALAELVQRFGRARVVRRSWTAALLLATGAASVVALALVV